MKKIELKKLIKDSIREVLREERIALIEFMIPSVSKKEMEEIAEKFGTPDRYNENEFIDKTDWVMK